MTEQKVSAKYDPRVKEYKLNPEQLKRYLAGTPMEEIMKEEGEEVGDPKVISYAKYKELEQENSRLKTQLEKLNFEQKSQQPSEKFELIINQKDSEIAELIKVATEWEIRISSISAGFNQAKEEIETLKKEVIDAHKLITDIQEQLNESQSTFEEAMAAKENLQKDNLILRNKTEKLTGALLETKDMYEEMKLNYQDLRREITPLRQLALMKLRCDLKVAQE